MTKINATLRIREIDEEAFYTLLEMVKAESRLTAHETFPARGDGQSQLREYDLKPVHEPIGPHLTPLIYASTRPQSNDPKPYVDFAGYRYKSPGSQRGTKMTYRPQQQYYLPRAHPANQFLIAFRNDLEALAPVRGSYSIGIQRSMKRKTAIQHHNGITKLIKGGPAEHARRVLSRYAKFISSLEA